MQKGNFITWPSIENLNFRKLIGTTVATELGHLDQEHKNLLSTHEQVDEEAELFPDAIDDKTYNFVCIITPARLKEKAYSDLTGQFPLKSSRSNEDICTMYDYDANAIL